MARASPLYTCSMSDVVLIDVRKFRFTSTPFAHHSIHSNQIPSKRIQSTCHEPEAVNEMQLFCNWFYLAWRHLAFTYNDFISEADVLFVILQNDKDGSRIKLLTQFSDKQMAL